MAHVGITIADLTSASTPLSGTEVLEIEKNGSSVKVTVDNMLTGGSVFSLSNVDGDPGADRLAFWDDSDGALEWGQVSTGLSLAADGTLTTDDSQIDHDSLNNFVANEHLDWTSASVGTIDDTNLSSNVPLLNASNTFTVATAFTAGGVGADSAIYLSANAPTLTWHEADATVDEGVWDARASGDIFSMRTVNDAENVAEPFFQVTRSGTTVSAVNFPNGTLQYGGVEVTKSDGTTGGTGTAGSGAQFVQLVIGGTTYKVLHDGTV